VTVPHPPECVRRSGPGAEGRKDGVGAGDFRKLINKELVPALTRTGVVRELRTQTFLPWYEKLWNTPNVAHDNPADSPYGER
jgi:hypothetical protein